MIDEQTVRISALNNRVPGTVLLLEVVASASRSGCWRSTSPTWGAGR